jgi:hypothetical protein
MARVVRAWEGAIMSSKFKAILSVVSVSAMLSTVALVRADEDQPLPAEAGDLSSATAIEVRDAGGQALLSGTFGAGEKDDDGDVERRADLRSASGAAGGEAEIEISSRAGEPQQELEFEVQGLPAGTSFGLFLDGRQITTFTTDERGRASAEMASR